MSDTNPAVAAQGGFAHNGVSSDDRTWGMLAHLSALAVMAIPFGNILGPLVVWLVRKDQSPFVDDQGREAVNFHIGTSIVLAVLYVFTLVMVAASGLIFPLPFVVLGVVLMIGFGIFVVATSIIGSIQAYKGTMYRYPVRMSFIK